MTLLKMTLLKMTLLKMTLLNILAAKASIKQLDQLAGFLRQFLTAEAGLYIYIMAAKPLLNIRAKWLVSTKI